MFIDISTLGLFAISTVVLTLIPGVDMLCALSNTINHGKKAGMITVLGTVTGVMCHIGLAVAGITALLASSPVLYECFVGAGAIYIMWVGYSIFNHVSAVNLENYSERKSFHKLYSQGLLTNLLNPKAIIFTLVFIPQFIRVEVGMPGMQMLLLGIELIVIILLTDFALIFLADNIATRIITNPTKGSYFNKISGTFILLLGFFILVLRFF